MPRSSFVSKLTWGKFLGKIRMVWGEMIVYKNTKATFHSRNGDTELFDIVTGVFQRDFLEP